MPIVRYLSLRNPFLVDHLTEILHKNLEIGTIWREDESSQQLLRLYKTKITLVFSRIRIGTIIYAKWMAVIAPRIFLYRLKSFNWTWLEWCDQTSYNFFIFFFTTVQCLSSEPAFGQAFKSPTLWRGPSLKPLNWRHDVNAAATILTFSALQGLSFPQAKLFMPLE